MSEAEPCEVMLHVHHTTERGALLSDDGLKKNARWVSRAHIEPREIEAGRAYTFTMPEWLAEKEGWI